MQKLVVLLVVVGLSLTGCAVTAARVKSEYRLAQGEKLWLELATPSTASKEEVAMLRERLTAQLADNGLLATEFDVSPHTIEVNVTRYYMRHIGARVMVGILAGSDNIRSTIRIKEAINGRVLSEFTIESKNPATWSTPRGLIEEHVDKVVMTLRGVKL